MDLIWAAKDYAIVDIQTTDLNRNWARPCEIGGVTLRRGTIDASDTYYTLINPQKTISKDCIAIHHITRAAVKYAPRFEDQARQFELFLRNKIIIIHSGNGFDIDVLRRRMKEYVFPMVLDTCKLAKNVDYSSPNHKLSTLVERYGLQGYIQRRLGEQNKQHRALYNAHATSYVFLHLINVLGERITLQQLLEVHG